MMRRKRKMIKMGTCGMMLAMLGGTFMEVPVALAASANDWQTGKQTPEQFFAQYAEAAMAVGREHGLYPSVMLAQTALESDYGNSTLSGAPNYNLFGIKGSYNGESVIMKTWEDDGKGNPYYIDAAFRKYPNEEASLQDYAHFFARNEWARNFYQGVFIHNTTTYQDATAWLTGRYATDTRYGAKLNSMIERYNLAQYDPETSQRPDTTQTPVGDAAPSAGNAQTHTVKTGDSLWAIGMKYGVSVASIQKWNNLSASVIFPGQQLKITGENTAQQPVVTPPATEQKAPAPVQQTPPPKPTVSPVSHTVKSGDSLWGISMKYGVSVANIQKWNNLSGTTIFPGQTLKVAEGTVAQKPVATPPQTAVTTPVKPTPAPVQTETAVRHTVKAGETLWAIAQKHGVSVAHIKEANSLKSDIIFVGQALTVKGGSATPAAPVANSVQANPKTIAVKAGDTLWAIATRSNTTVANLKSLNNLKSDVILPGQSLRVK